MRATHQRTAGHWQTLLSGMLVVVGLTTAASACRAHTAQEGSPDEPNEVCQQQAHSPQDRIGPRRPAEEQRTANSFSQPWWEWEYATGDWMGGRPWLEDHGLTFEISYSADFFYNLLGGLNTSDAEQYRGLLGVSLTLDTERMGLWKDGTAFVSMFENHGTDITERHVGDLQALNNADAPDRTRLYEFWYQHSFLDGALQLKFGKMDANADFAAPDFGAEFIHSSPGFSPTLPIPTWPDPALGAAVFLEPADWFYLRAAVYDAEGSGTRAGFDTAFHTPDDAFAIWELGLRPQFDLLGQEDLPGTYRIGGFYHSGEWDVIFNDLDGRRRPRSQRGNAGAYLVFDQLLYREPPPDVARPERLPPAPSSSEEALEDESSEQGLGVFFQFGWVPSDYNEITQHYGGGIQYVGLVPGRDDDIFGLGVHHVSLSSQVQSLEERYSETAVETFYKLQLTDFMSIKPDLQYIVNPGGAGRDAFVAGARLEIAF